MNLYPTTVILSAERFTLSERDNLNRSIELTELLREQGFTYKQVYGMYKSSKETSYVVPITDLREIQQLSSLATQFDQESILVLNPDRTGYLLHANGTEESFGMKRLVEVSVNEALELDAYTYDPETITMYAMI